MSLLNFVKYTNKFTLSCIVKKIDVLLHCEKKDKMYNLNFRIWKQLSVIRS